MSSPVIKGKVAWSGDNPGIYLQDEHGAWQSLAVYFRVVVSPFGAGAGTLILGAPREASGWPASQNLCLTTNEPLMRWLVDDFVSRFASFRDALGLRAMTYVVATTCQSQGDGKSFHEESMAGIGVSTSMRWESLSAPFAADVAPPQSSTGEHQMLSVFVGAKTGTIRVNDVALPGRVIERDFLGGRLSTAFLAFSETWITPSAA
ncbi:MAG: hypothetical protein ABIW85_05875 [Variovorax sp.]